LTVQKIRNSRLKRAEGCDGHFFLPLRFFP
jgi:hypothetical protein